jgi:predicted RNase H-like HicB family nuclease
MTLIILEPAPVAQTFPPADPYSALPSARKISPVEGDNGYSAEMVEDLPLTLVARYAELACHHARVVEVDPGVWFASVVGIEGPWGDGDTPQKALDELHEAIIGWVAVKRRVGANDIPSIEGIDLNLQASG